MGMHFTLACPKGYGPDPGLLARAEAQARVSGATLAVVHDPAAAARGADVLYTDVWTSMGQEEERARRLKDFQGREFSLAYPENWESLDSQSSSSVTIAPEIVSWKKLPSVSA
jgi:ornithine carbamoyltransferase